uniref:Ninjurin-1-like n=1 Tax=Paramormyrops kingsleyae TaxID=1676925 RepID=A0A3B3RL70_9TELE
MEVMEMNGELETLRDEAHRRPQQQAGPLNMNHYANKKSAAESMLDVALLMANASQLKTVMEEGSDFTFYYALIGLISISLALQILVGILLIFIGEQYLFAKMLLTVQCSTRTYHSLYYSTPHSPQYGQLTVNHCLSPPCHCGKRWDTRVPLQPSHIEESCENLLMYLSNSGTCSVKSMSFCKSDSWCPPSLPNYSLF